MKSKCILAALVSASALAGGNAAVVTWGSAYNFTAFDQTLFLDDFDASRNGGLANPNVSSSVVQAISYGGNGDVTVNGINFTEAPGFNDSWGFPGMDLAIDTILSGHTNAVGTNPFALTLNGLTPGATYQIQLIGIHDSRGCCSGRKYTVDNGAGSYVGGPELTRAGYGNVDPPNPPAGSFGTVVGTFTADFDTQTILIGGNTGDSVDGGLSGYSLIQSVPEPSSAALLGLGGLALCLRRRK